MFVHRTRKLQKIKPRFQKNLKQENRKIFITVECLFVAFVFFFRLLTIKIHAVKQEIFS